MLLMIQLLKTDNEEIGILCVKIILDLNRSNYKSILESHVPAFIDAVQEMFENMENVVKEVFSIDAKSPANAEVSYLYYCIGLR
jgi:transformation/transcription domain-associated protein